MSLTHGHSVMARINTEHNLLNFIDCHIKVSGHKAVHVLLDFLGVFKNAYSTPFRPLIPRESGPLIP